MLGRLFALFQRKVAAPSLTQQVFSKSMCPVCLTPNSLLAGPEGGLSINVMCECCGTRLNLMPPLGLVDWTHGPQGDIWGGRSQTIFPTDAQVALARNKLARP
jgi:hypothetical protein